MYHKGTLRPFSLSPFIFLLLFMLGSITYVITSYPGVSDTHANGETGVTQQENPQNHVARNQNPPNKGNGNQLLMQTAIELEPLLLLMLGAILFSVAWAIKLVLLRSEGPKPEQTF